MSPEFWITALVATVTPGTGVLFTVAAGLAHGRRAGVLAAVASTLALLPHVALAVSGVALVVAADPVLFGLLKWGGVGYLLYLAWSSLRASGPLALGPTDAAPRTARQMVVAAVLVNLLNPKLTVFFVALLPQFVPTGAPVAASMLTLGLAAMALTLVVFTGYALAAASCRRAVLERPRVLAWLRRALAVSFVALGARLALAAR